MKTGLFPMIVNNEPLSSKLIKQGKMMVEIKRVLWIKRHNQRVTSEVKSTKQNFFVALDFNQYNKIDGFECNCIDGSRGKICRHVAALMCQMEFDIPNNIARQYNIGNLLDYLIITQEEKAVTDLQDKYIEAENAAYFFDGLFEKENREEIINQEIAGVMINQKPLKLGIHILVQSQTFMGEKDTRWFVNLKIGEEKLYIVKSLKYLLSCYEFRQKLEFGRRFTYDPKVHFFNKDQERFIEFLRSLKDIYFKKESEYVYYETYQSYISNKTLVIKDEFMIKQLLVALKHLPFEVTIEDDDYEHTFLCQGIRTQLPEFTIEVLEDKSNEESLIVNVEEIARLVPLTKDLEFISYDEGIYQLLDSEQLFIKALWELEKHKGKYLPIPKGKKEHFFTQIYPRMKESTRVIIPESIEHKLVQEELKTKVYFERTKSGGTLARVKYIYGERSFDASHLGSEQQTSIGDEAYILRDLEKEETILEFFQGFEKTKDGYLEENDGFMFSFIEERLDLLKEVAEVFYEKNMMPLTTEMTKLSSHITMSGNDFFEVDLEKSSYSSEDLKLLYFALKEKKTFVRLKSGPIINLESQEAKDYVELIDELNIPIKNINKSKVKVPLYRAFAFNHLLGERKIKTTKDQGFTDFLNRFAKDNEHQFKLSEDFEAIMRPYQKSGYRWLAQLMHVKMGAILADDMGLGKTLQTIALLDQLYIEETRPTIIIAPTSLVYNWEAEFLKFASHLNVEIIDGNKSIREKQLEAIESKKIIITSYSLVLRDLDYYKSIDFARCIIDEAQNIKNPVAKSTKAIKQLKASGYIALTGTPVENNLTELWSIFDFVMPGYLLSHAQFIKQYEKPIASGDLVALKRLKRQIAPFILRRMKIDVLKELPPKIETKSIAHMTGEQEKVYMAYLQEAKDSMTQTISENGFNQSKIQIFAYLTRLRQICCHPSTFIDNYRGGSGKLDLLEELLIESIESGHKILLFSQFTSMLAIIKDMLEKSNTTFDYIDGAIKSKERHRRVTEFNEGTTKVFLISLKAGGTGHNLTGADIVIHYDPWWNPAVEDQATDRAYRIGQTSRVQVFKLITHGTIEEKIYKLQQRKKEMIASVIEPGETFISKMTEEELKSIFE